MLLKQTWPWLALLALACGGDEAPTSVSAKARVQPKAGKVWAQDLANGLGLQTWELCAELGAYDCVEEAHLVTLGGVEPTVLGVNDPLPNASVSAPIATDRVAVSACAARWARDAASPAPVVFGAVLDKDDEKARKEVSEGLIQRLLGRHPNDAEVASLLDLHAALEPVSAELTRDWAVGACVVVATSTEALFY